MPASVDVYRDWLGISEAVRPLNYYQLLKLKQFEDDVAKIRATYRQMNAHVRKFATGDFATQSQELLNELAKAMLCLTDATRKAEYDASLGREDQGEAKRRTLEQILVGRKVLDTTGLDKARRYAKTVGVEMRDAVLQQRLASADHVMQCYAESIGLPFVDLGEMILQPALLSKVPAVLARQHSCAPLMVDDRQLLMVSPNPLSPEVEEQLRMRFDLPVRSVLCTPASMNEVIGKNYPREAAAAEMSSSPSAAARPTKAKAVEKEVDHLSPEVRAALSRQNKLYGFIGFNFGLLLFSIVGSFLDWPVQWGMMFYPYAIVVGLIVGVITWIAAKAIFK